MINNNELIFGKLTIRNFGSVGAETQEVDLSSDWLTLILGQGVNARGVESRSGAGKTTIMHAISYVLFNIALKRTKLSHLVNEINGKNMLVTLEFTKHGVPYRIERGQSPKVLRLINLDGDSNDTKADNAATDEDIVELIGFDHTMFLYLFGLNTIVPPFLDADASKQREIIEKLLGAYQLSEKAKVVSKEISTTKGVVKDERTKIEAIIEANRRIEAAMRESREKKDTWDEQHETKLRGLRASLSRLIDRDFDAELVALDEIDRIETLSKGYRDEISAAQREIAAIEREASSIEAEIERMRKRSEILDPEGLIAALGRKRASLEQDRIRAGNKIRNAEQDLVSAKNEVEQVVREIENADGSNCTTCGQSLDGTAHLDKIMMRLAEKFDKAQGKVTQIANEIETLQRDATSFDGPLADIDQEVEKTNQKLTDDLAALKEEYALVKAAAGEIRAEQDVHRSKIADQQGLLDALPPKPVVQVRSRDEIYRAQNERDRINADIDRENEQTNPHVDHLESFKATIQEIDETALNAALHLQKHQELILNLLTKPDSFIRKKVIDQNLQNLNDRFSYYLDKLGLSHEVEVRNDLEVEITYNGYERDSSQFSRGENNRVTLAMCFAFRDVWENLNHSVNLLMIDELLDAGMDSAIAEAGSRLLKKMAYEGKNIFLISHKEELRGRVDRTLIVSKEDEFSRFFYE